MDEKKKWAIEKAIELTRSALESPTGNNDDLLRPGQAAVSGIHRFGSKRRRRIGARRVHRGNQSGEHRRDQ